MNFSKISVWNEIGNPFATQLFGVNLFKTKGWWSVAKKSSVFGKVNSVRNILVLHKRNFHFVSDFDILNIVLCIFFCTVSKPVPPWEGTAVVNGEFKELKITDFKGKLFLCAHRYSCNLENWEPCVKSNHRFVKILYEATSNSAGSSLTL